jgi:hypothetical protein
MPYPARPVPDLAPHDPPRQADACRWAIGRPILSPARGPPTDWGELVQIHDDRDVIQASPDELPAIDIHRL